MTGDDTVRQGRAPPEGHPAGALLDAKRRSKSRTFSSGAERHGNHGGAVARPIDVKPSTTDVSLAGPRSGSLGLLNGPAFSWRRSAETPTRPPGCQLQSMGFQFSVAFWTALLDHHLGEARAALGPEAEAVWQAGQRLSLQEAMAEASTS